MIRFLHTSDWQLGMTRHFLSEFEMDLHEKLSDKNFLSDIEPLIAPDTVWRFDDASGYVQHDILPLLPGEPWRGGEKPPARPA